MKTLSEKLAKNLEYYTNDPTKRCRKEGECKYLGETLGLKTKGCFVGSLLPYQTRKLVDEYIVGDVETLVEREKELDYKLPKIITENVNLMGRFQNLHDMDQYWDEYGLTDEGKRYLQKRILYNYDELDEEDFLQFLK